MPEMINQGSAGSIMLITVEVLSGEFLAPAHLPWGLATPSSRTLPGEISTRKQVLLFLELELLWWPKIFRPTLIAKLVAPTRQLLVPMNSLRGLQLLLVSGVHAPLLPLLPLPHHPPWHLPLLVQQSIVELMGHALIPTQFVCVTILTLASVARLLPSTDASATPLKLIAVLTGRAAMALARALATTPGPCAPCPQLPHALTESRIPTRLGSTVEGPLRAVLRAQVILGAQIILPPALSRVAQAPRPAQWIASTQLQTLL